MKLGDVMKLSKGNLVSIEDDKEYIIAVARNQDVHSEQSKRRN